MNIIKCKKTILHDFSYITFWKRQNYGQNNNKKSVATRVWREEKINRHNIEDFQGNEIILYDVQWWIHIIIN